MAYSYVSQKSGRTYYLHSQTVTLRGSGRTQTIYFFAPDIRSGSENSVPAGYVVGENPRTGLPYLKKG